MLMLAELSVHGIQVLNMSLHGFPSDQPIEALHLDGHLIELGREQA